MQIILSPVRSDDALSLSVAGDVATINGRVYDLSPLADRARLPAEALDCPLLAGPVVRLAGEVRLSLILPHGMDADEAVRFPPVPCPPDQVPGLVPWEGDPLPGVIDWAQMQTAEAQAAARLEEWRDGAVASRLDLALALAQAGLISPASMIAAAQGQIPAEFSAVVEALPEALRLETAARWAGAAQIPRRNAFIAMVQQAAGLSDAQVDTLYGWAG